MLCITKLYMSFDSLEYHCSAHIFIHGILDINGVYLTSHRDI